MLLGTKGVIEAALLTCILRRVIIELSFGEFDFDFAGAYIGGNTDSGTFDTFSPVT